MMFKGEGILYIMEVCVFIKILKFIVLYVKLMKLC